MTITKHKNNTINLIEMLFTNVCHEMSGVIGAIGNAAELLENNNPLEPNVTVQQQAFNLIKSSSSDAINRIKMYRRAYASDDDHADTSLHDYCSDFMEFLELKGVALVMPIGSKERYYKAYVSRIVLNTLLLVHSIMPNKESIKLQVKKKENDSIVINVICVMRQELKVENKIFDVLLGKEKCNISVSTVQAHFLRQLAAEYGCEMRISTGDKLLDIALIFGEGHYS